MERARFHSSMIDARMLKASQDFKELKDSYVIFIYKKDKFKEGLLIYHIDRYVRETGKLFEDGFWMSGGHPLRTDRSEAETVRLCVNQ